MLLKISHKYFYRCCTVKFSIETKNNFGISSMFWLFRVRNSTDSLVFVCAFSNIFIHSFMKWRCVREIFQFWKTVSSAKRLHWKLKNGVNSCVDYTHFIHNTISWKKKIKQCHFPIEKLRRMCTPRGVNVLLLLPTDRKIPKNFFTNSEHINFTFLCCMMTMTLCTYWD